VHSSTAEEEHAFTTTNLSQASTIVFETNGTKYRGHSNESTRVAIGDSDSTPFELLSDQKNTSSLHPKHGLTSIPAELQLQIIEELGFKARWHLKKVNRHFSAMVELKGLSHIWTLTTHREVWEFLVTLHSERIISPTKLPCFYCHEWRRDSNLLESPHRLITKRGRGGGPIENIFCEDCGLTRRFLQRSGVIHVKVGLGHSVRAQRERNRSGGAHTKHVDRILDENLDENLEHYICGECRKFPRETAFCEVCGICFSCSQHEENVSQEETKTNFSSRKLKGYKVGPEALYKRTRDCIHEWNHFKFFDVAKREVHAWSFPVREPNDTVRPLQEKWIGKWASGYPYHD